MTNPDLLLATTEAEIGREIIRLVPHWYEAPYGPEHYTIPVGGHTGPILQSLPPHAQLADVSVEDLCPHEGPAVELFVNLPSLIRRAPGEFCHRVAAHALADDRLGTVHQVPGIARPPDLREPAGGPEPDYPPGGGVGRHHAAADPEVLRSPGLVGVFYLAVDSELRLIDYGEVEWSQVKAATSYKLHPEFLHPIHSVMGDTDLSAHLTTGGDLIIMSKAGLLATRRNRKWKIYDVRTFKNSLAYCLGSHTWGRTCSRWSSI